jgi:hypothetical protein
MRTQAESTICFTCASKQKLRFTPCQEHQVGQNPSTCKHARTTLGLSHNGSYTYCYDCGSDYNHKEETR